MLIYRVFYIYKRYSIFLQKIPAKYENTDFCGDFQKNVIYKIYKLENILFLCLWNTYFSFFPNIEKWTYRLGCALRSVSRESAETTAASMWL